MPGRRVVVDQRDIVQCPGRAGDLEPADIELHGVQVPGSREDQVTALAVGGELAFEDRAALARLQVEQRDRPLLQVRAAPVQEDDRLAVRKAMRPTMAVLGVLDIEHRQGLRLATRGRDAEEATREVRSEDDLIVVGPGRAARVRRVGENDRRPTRGGNLLQGTEGEEADPLAVG